MKDIKEEIYASNVKHSHPFFGNYEKGVFSSIETFFVVCRVPVGLNVTFVCYVMVVSKAEKFAENYKKSRKQKCFIFFS